MKDTLKEKRILGHTAKKRKCCGGQTDTVSFQQGGYRLPYVCMAASVSTVRKKSITGILLHLTTSFGGSFLGVKALSETPEVFLLPQQRK